MKSLIVNDKFDNKKLDVFLYNAFPNLSKNTLYKALRKKDIRINNIKVSQNVVLHVNDNVAVYIDDKYLLNSPLNIDIVYEDDNILVINKPQGIEVTR